MANTTERVFVPYSALTKDELYALLNLRQQVFVVEQDCPFIDADFKDQDCDHLLAYQNNELKPSPQQK